MSSLRTDVWLGLGSNLDNPQHQIEQALDSIQKQFPHQDFKASALFCSKPLGPQDQPDYVNAVVRLETHLTPWQCLHRTQALEIQHQRQKTRHWGERTLDVDLLLAGHCHIRTTTLTVPHPQMLRRDFVLLPMHSIAQRLPPTHQPSYGGLAIDWSIAIKQLQTTYVTTEKRCLSK